MREAVRSLVFGAISTLLALFPWSPGEGQEGKGWLQVIVVEKEQEANELKNSLREGRSFDEVALELAPEGLKTKRGYLGEVPLGKLKPIFGEKLAKTYPGEITGPLQGETGWFIFRVLSREEASKYEALGESPGFHLDRGLILGEMGDEEGEIQAYSKAIEMDNELPEAHANLGEALRRKAMRTLQVSGYEGREMPSQALELLDEAIDELKAAIALDGSLWEAHYNLGLAYAAQGLIGLTVLEFKEALKIRGDSGELHRALAQALILDGRLEEAKVHLERAAQLGAEVSGLKAEVEKRLKPRGKKGK